MSDESKRSQFNRWWSQFGRNNMEPSHAAWIGWLERDRMGEVAPAPEAQPLNWVRVDYGPPSDAPAWPGETIFFVDKHRTRWRLELPQLPLAMNSGERNG